MVFTSAHIASQATGENHKTVTLHSSLSAMAALLSIHSPPPMSLHRSRFSFSPPNPTIRSPPKPPIFRAVLERTHELQVPYQLKHGQSRFFHKLPSGLNMEVIIQKSFKNDPGEPESLRPPLVFVHGSFHAAWCWAEHWLPFFSGFGYDCYAISLLGQGESDMPTGSVAGSLQTHASDVADFIQKEIDASPVLLGHSFGGLIIQSYISNMRTEHLKYEKSGYEREGLHARLAGAVLICSVPPSGNRYQELMRASSRVPLFDLKKLNSSLPVPSVPKNFLELLVLGAGDDFIVDAEGLTETAKFYSVSPVCVEGVAHDMMLDSSWEKGANMILSWLTNLSK